MGANRQEFLCHTSAIETPIPALRAGNGNRRTDRRHRGPTRIAGCPPGPYCWSWRLLVLSLAFGTIRLPVEQAWHVLDVHVRGGSVEATADQIVWGLRLPRTVLAVVAGAGLSVGGAVMQTLVRNPLADPYMLGVSAGASVGATAVITTGTLAAFGVYSLYLWVPFSVPSSRPRPCSASPWPREV